MLQEAYRRLFDFYGPQGWWPGETPWEVVVGAVLVQNTAWKNVERAIENLRRADALPLSSMQELTQDELEEFLRPAGYYRQKARRLRGIVTHIMQHHAGSLEAMLAQDGAALREELLLLHGIGPETADAIALYAAEVPTFVVDTYTQRVVKRHGWIEPEADYRAVQDFFESSLPHEVPLFQEYHALLVQVGKDFCRKRAKCAGCPLEELLPAGGMVDPEAW